MNLYTAVQAIECNDVTEEVDLLAAWQYLIDTGACWTLQGAYGRQAERLIEAGQCSPPPGWI
jgi:hypothetical protein